MKPTKLRKTNGVVTLVTGCLPIGTPPWDMKRQRTNLNAEPDNDCLLHTHYDEAVKYAFLQSELKNNPWRPPRTPSPITGVFVVEGRKHVVLSDMECNLLAVYRVYEDGSIQQILDIPDSILFAYRPYDN